VKLRAALDVLFVAVALPLCAVALATGRWLIAFLAAMLSLGAVVGRRS
jgi:hypothetical protein